METTGRASHSYSLEVESTAPCLVGSAGPPQMPMHEAKMQAKIVGAKK